MKETKTANAGPGCPTLMHYVARLLLHSDPTLVTFIDDLPNLENAARSKRIADDAVLAAQLTIFVHQSLYRQRYRLSALSSEASPL